MTLEFTDWAVEILQRSHASARRFNPAVTVRMHRSGAAVEFELAESHMLADLSRREADLLIREQVPDLASLVARRLGHVAYAVYGTPHLVADTSATRDALREVSE